MFTIYKKCSRKNSYFWRERIILNVFHKFGEKYPMMVIKDVTKLTSEFTGVSVNTINAISLEISRTGKVTSLANGEQKEVEEACIGLVL